MSVKAKICPKCKAEHPVNAAYCGCGHTWKKQDDVGYSPASDPLYGCCQWSSGGKRCHYPGAINPSVGGGGRWLCRAHDRCEDAMLGAAIVDQSHEDIPNPDYRPEAIRAAKDRQHWKATQISLRKQGLAWDPKVMSREEYVAMLREMCGILARQVVARATGLDRRAA